jgi:hypothetical protein
MISTKPFATMFPTKDEGLLSYGTANLLVIGLAHSRMSFKKRLAKLVYQR